MPTQASRLKLGTLEQRFTPATLTWVAPAMGAWENPDNWDAKVVPTASDQVEIHLPGVDVVVNAPGASPVSEHLGRDNFDIARRWSVDFRFVENRRAIRADGRSTDAGRRHSNSRRG